jgi:hypothetical protein
MRGLQPRPDFGDSAWAVWATGTMAVVNMVRKDAATKSMFAVLAIEKCLPRSRQDVWLAEMIAAGGRGR